MKVKELIAELQKLPPDYEVFCHEYGSDSTIRVGSIKKGMCLTDEIGLYWLFNDEKDFKNSKKDFYWLKNKPIQDYKENSIVLVSEQNG